MTTEKLRGPAVLKGNIGPESDNLIHYLAMLLSKIGGKEKQSVKARVNGFGRN